jgi:uncharacterized membrane protein
LAGAAHGAKGFRATKGFGRHGMRHMMFMHGFAGGFAGFLFLRMMRRVMMLVLLVVLVGAVFYFWQRSRRPPDAW